MKQNSQKRLKISSSLKNAFTLVCEPRPDRPFHFQFQQGKTALFEPNFNKFYIRDFTLMNKKIVHARRPSGTLLISFINFNAPFSRIFRNKSQSLPGLSRYNKVDNSNRTHVLEFSSHETLEGLLFHFNV